MLVIEKVPPEIKMRLRIALRPTESPQVMQLFQEWVAKRQFAWLDIILREMLVNAMVGVNLLNKKAVRYALDPDYSVVWSLIWSEKRYNIQHADRHKKTHNNYGLVDE